MKRYIGLWDALFGQRVTIELPAADGGVRKIEVTKKWMEHMQQNGKMKPLPPSTVKVNILDPMGGLSASKCEDPADFLQSLGEPRDEYRIEYWTIDEQVPRAQYDNFVDPQTKELYALTTYENGRPITCLIQKGLWEQARNAMRDV